MNRTELPLPPRQTQSPLLAMVAGEASGDLLGSLLVRSLAPQLPDFRIAGIGGPLMQQYGMQPWWPSERLSVFGYADALRRLPELLWIRRQLKQRLLQQPTRLFVGIDAPDFNLGLEQSLRAHGIPTVHFVCPSIWAWRPERIERIRRSANHVLCLFPFEPEILNQRGISASYVGHPLAEEIPVDTQGRVPGQVLLMPGSRAQELHHHTGLLADVVDRVRAHRSDVSFVVARARNIDPRALEPLVQRNVDVVDDAHAAMQTASAGIIKAGTSTLEAAFRGLPFATFYRTSPLSYAISKRLVTVTSVTMMNLLLKRNVVHEYIQHDATSTRIADEIETLLDDSARRTELVTAMSDVREMLSGEGASKRTAALIVEALRR